jgi:hypothetical protein
LVVEVHRSGGEAAAREASSEPHSIRIALSSLVGGRFSKGGSGPEQLSSGDNPAGPDAFRIAFEVSQAD